MEASTESRVIEAAVPKTLPTPFPNLTFMRDPGAEFYAKFQRSAEDYARPTLKKYEQDLDSTLIFAGLFSGITTAFIIDVQRQLKPDYQEMSYLLLRIIANTSLGNTPTGADRELPQWNGPNPTAVRIQSILYWSLSSSLFAAFVATLGKQWLNRYASEDRGSAADRGRQRKLKMDGMIAWKFDFVIEFLPILLQVSYLLLGCALSKYLFPISEAVSGVLIAFTAVGFLLYSLITLIATLNFNCPFQTPPSLLLGFLIRTKRSKGCGRWMKERWTKFMHNGPNTPPRLDTVDGNNVIEHNTIPMDAMDRPSPLFSRDVDWDVYVLDSDCIAFMFGMPAEMDATVAILGFIPEIVWHNGIREIPLKPLYQTFIECFDRSSGHLVLKWAFRDMAYLSGKALLHVAIQRKCIDDEFEQDMSELIAGQHQVVESKHIEGDPDLETTLHMISQVLGGFEIVRQQNQQKISVSISHHAWMVRILLYRAWDALEKNTPLPSDVTQFIRHSLRLEPRPSDLISADYLFMLFLVLGIKVNWDDLWVTNKSAKVGPPSTRIHDALIKKFQSSTWTTGDDIDCALLALRAFDIFECILPPPSHGHAQKSFDLFHVIDNIRKADKFPNIFSYEKQWEASRLTMHAAYGSGKFRPPVEDPQAVLGFLDHHLDWVAPREENQGEPIQNALRALVETCHPAMIAGVKGFELTGKGFVHGICQLFRDDKPSQLRKAALFFLPLISDQWFNAVDPILDFNGRKTLCINWASVVDGIGIEPTPDTQRAILAVLLGMMNSPHWRPYIPMDKWKFLEYFTSVPDDSQPLKRCIDNEGLIDAVNDVGNPRASFLWLEILWLKYGELNPLIREQLETATNDVLQGGGRADLEVYMAVIDLQLQQAQDLLALRDQSSVTALRTKIDNLRQASVSLATFL